MNAVDKNKRKRNLDMGLIIRLGVLVLLIAVLTIINKNFLGAYNISSFLDTVSLILAMSIGVTFILLIGSIDLSLGAIVSCGAVIMARLIPVMGAWAFLVVLLFGAAAGLINGLLFTLLKIPSFICTLATMSVFTSLALIISDSTPLQIPADYKPMTSWINIDLGPIPLILIIVIAVLFIFWVVQEKTKFGKNCFAVGTNEQAARMCGVNVNVTKVVAFTLAGLCYAMGTIIVTSRLMSGIPTVGDSYTMICIAAVALGGTSLAGGKGGVMLTLLGTLISTVINNGMVVIGVNAYWQQIVYGVIIIISLATSTDRRKTNLVVK